MTCCTFEYLKMKVKYNFKGEIIKNLKPQVYFEFSQLYQLNVFKLLNNIKE